MRSRDHHLTSRLLLPGLAALLIAAATMPSSHRSSACSTFARPCATEWSFRPTSWMPAEGGPFATFIVRTPYLKTMAIESFTLAGWATYFAERGYAVVIQDTRGRGDSDGDFGFFFQEGEDGYDTIEWMAAQPWVER